MLTASDLNASFAYITTNALSAISPLTGTLDCDGQILILDADADSSLQAASDDVLTLKLQGASLFVWNGATASAVNGVTFTAGATGSAAVMAATGSDTNINLQLRSKGTGDVIIADASGEEIAIFADVATAVNELTFTNAAAGGVPQIAATGGDTNVSIELFPKGTGAVFVTGTYIGLQGADVASANALPVNIAGNMFDVTGTTSITSIATKGVGSIVTLQFDGVLTLTHHSTDLILPGGQDIITYAGYVATFYEYASGDWRFVSDNRAAYTTAPITTTGGTSVEFTGIPSWARRITLIVGAISGSAGFEVECTVGTASAYATSGYSSLTWLQSTGALATDSASLRMCRSGGAGYTYRGAICFDVVKSTNGLIWTGNLQAGSGDAELHSGRIDLLDSVTRMKLDISAGTFDAMQIALRIEP